MNANYQHIKKALILLALLVPRIDVTGLSRSELDIFNPSDKLAPFILAEMSKWNFYKPIEKTQVLKQLDSEVEVTLSIDPQFQKDVEKIRDQNPSDYLAIVVIDNETGKILALAEKDKLQTQKNKSIILTNSHPSASLIKVITSAALLENDYADLGTQFPFVGRATTLYRTQLNPGTRRGIKRVTLKEAFATSNNPVFGLAAIENLNLKEIQAMADGFGFNRQIMKYPLVSVSQFPEPQDQYNLAELASGLNTDTNMSLIHAVTIPYIIVNGGELKQPTLVEKIRITDQGKSEEIQVAPDLTRKVISKQTSWQLMEAMQSTVIKGTARNAFRGFPERLRKKLLIGGKTGSITGGDPAGKHDWFTSFAIPLNKKEGKGISIAVLTVNTQKWYLKSSRTTRDVIEKYYKNK